MDWNPILILLYLLALTAVALRLSFKTKAFSKPLAQFTHEEQLQGEHATNSENTRTYEGFRLATIAQPASNAGPAKNAHATNAVDASANCGYWHSFSFQIIASLAINCACSFVCLKHLQLQALQNLSNIQLFEIVALCSIVEAIIGITLLSSTCSYFKKVDISYSYTFHWLNGKKKECILQIFSIAFSIAIICILLKIFQLILAVYCIDVYYTNLLFTLSIFLLFSINKIDVFRHLTTIVVLVVMISMTFFALHITSYANLLYDLSYLKNQLLGVKATLFLCLKTNPLLLLALITPKITPVLFSSAHSLGNIEKIRKHTLYVFIPMIILLFASLIISIHIPTQDITALLSHLERFSIIYPAALLSCIALLLINIILHLDSATTRINLICELLPKQLGISKYSVHTLAVIILISALLILKINAELQYYLINLFCIIYFGYIACTNTILLAFIGWGVNKTKNLNRLRSYIILFQYLLVIGLYSHLGWQLIFVLCTVSLLCFARIKEHLLSLMQNAYISFSSISLKYIIHFTKLAHEERTKRANESAEPQRVNEVQGTRTSTTTARSQSTVESQTEASDPSNFYQQLYYAVIQWAQRIRLALADVAQQYYPKNYVIIYVSCFSIISTSLAIANLGNIVFKNHAIVSCIIPSIYTLSTLTVILAVWRNYQSTLIPIRYILWYSVLFWSLLGSAMCMLYISRFANYQLLVFLTNVLIFGYLVPKSILITSLFAYLLFILSRCDSLNFDTRQTFAIYSIPSFIIFMITFIKSYKWSEIPLTLIDSLDTRITKLQSSIAPEYSIKKHVKREVLYKQSRILDVFNSELYHLITQDDANIDKNKLSTILNTTEYLTTQMCFYVQNILNASRVFTSHKKNHKKSSYMMHDLSLLLRDSLQTSLILRQNPKQLKIKSDIENKIFFKCNQQQISQIFLNTLLSAISLDKKEQEIYVFLKKKQNYIHFYVGFTGHSKNLHYVNQFDTTGLVNYRGIEAETLDFILCKEIVQENKGTMLIENSFGLILIKIQFKI
ncbi:hypothetical protein Sarmat_00737 [Rickettsiales endosymbiont of Paramecium tredecaurelia]|uniref:hypothetical protein n=1 Tax=Candidatus Sarmatiella mevalonica TaxID=2770581 RepID=UPI001922124D|nr:hypothetical protein [Candidatus Sarmatiella mevalonica]MBL3284879.1 hypothetical protein [Candidatus Sarmatiella mevalonica]